MNNTFKKFNDYSKELGWKRIQSESQRNRFYNTLSNDHPSMTEKVFDLIDSRGSQHEDIDIETSIANESVYEEKNKDLDFSLRLTNYLIHEKLYNIFTNIDFLKIDPPPKRILDLGSDNGIVTIFLAKLFPDAKIIGVEETVNGVLISKKLAERLGCNNCDFIQGNFFKLDSLGKFDLITSFTFMMEAIEAEYGIYMNELYDDENFISVKNEVKSDLNKFSKLFADKLQDDGLILSFERLSGMFAVCKFLDGFEDGSFVCDVENSMFIDYNDVEGKGSMPFLIFQKGSGKNLISQMQKLYGKPEPIQKQDFLKDPFYSFCFFNSIDKKKNLLTVSCEYYNGSGTLFFKFYESEMFFMPIQFSNTGFFELSIMPHLSKNDLEEEIKNINENLVEHCDINVNWHI